MPDYLNALRHIRAGKPLIHCVSNIVSANDCANLLLAIGASPMMAQAAEEMEEIAAISSAVVLNLGTPDGARFELCAQRGALAARFRQPCVLDPVGAGASRWRLDGIRSLLECFTPSILRVNLSEARALLGEEGCERGVDSADADGTNERVARALARKLHTTVLLSGEADCVSDGMRSALIGGGSPMMAMVTGSGCMLSALCGAFAVAEPDAFVAAAAASKFWKDCATRAAQAFSGPASFRTSLIDAAYFFSKD